MSIPFPALYAASFSFAPTAAVEILSFVIGTEIFAHKKTLTTLQSVLVFFIINYLG